MINTAKTMKLLSNVFLYAIKCDYFMWSEEKGEYTEPVYWAIDTSTKANIIIMRENVNDPQLRVFDSLTAAKTYIKDHTTGFDICMENVRPVKINYNFDRKEWEECIQN